MDKNLPPKATGTPAPTAMRAAPSTLEAPAACCS